MSDQERFEFAIQTILNQTDKGRGIGTLGEKVLHAIVKLYKEPDVSKHEQKLGTYVADIFTGDSVVEIQTRQFAKLRAKLACFLADYPVTIVYPIPARKWLVWIDPKTGEATKERRSPKRGDVYDCLKELYAIKPLLDHPNLTIELLFVDLKELRLLNGWSEDRKRGSRREDRIPTAYERSVMIGGKHGYDLLLPETLAPTFTSADYAKHAHVHPKRAQTAITILKSVSIIRPCGKKGRFNVYERAGKTEDPGNKELEHTR